MFSVIELRQSILSYQIRQNYSLRLHRNKQRFPFNVLHFMTSCVCGMTMSCTISGNSQFIYGHSYYLFADVTTLVKRIIPIYRRNVMAISTFRTYSACDYSYLLPERDGTQPLGVTSPTKLLVVCLIKQETSPSSPLGESQVLNMALQSGLHSFIDLWSGRLLLLGSRH